VTWVAPPAGRTPPPYLADERTRLDSWLDFYRATLLAKCAGLTAAQLVIRPLPASGLSLLGLVRHMAANERIWFRIRASGAEIDDLYDSPEYPDGAEFAVSAGTAQADLAIFAAETEAARRAMAGRSLDEQVGDETHTVDLRWICTHMIDEYVRHTGHADILRELIDGTTGY
jgi:uncharacterized damage-inducible protein DinB